MSTSTGSNLLIVRQGAQRGAGIHAQDPDLLERRVDDVIHATRRAWPTVELATDRGVAHLARHLPEGVTVERALDELQLEQARQDHDLRAYHAVEPVYDVNRWTTIGLYAIGGAAVVIGGILRLRSGRPGGATVALRRRPEGGGVVAVEWAR